MKRPVLEHVMLLVGAAYLAMLTLPVSIVGRCFLHDLLVPVMGAGLLAAARPAALLARHRMLACFLGVAALAAAWHAVQAPGELYEWIVFATLAVVFMFYARLPLAPALCGRLAMILFGLVTLAFAYEMTPMPSLFSFESPQMKSTAMAFLSRRFAFTQGNPNLFALYLAIPAALTVRYIHGQDWTAVPIFKRLLAFPALAIVMLPVLSSASKHGLLPLALLLGCLPALFPAARRWLQVAAVCALVLLAAVFETTVLCTVFPVTRQGINTSPGMYWLHQSTYLRMLEGHPGALALGLGEAQARELYPAYAEPAVVAATLERYNAMASYGNFITYMDPHNEYLNLATLFGVPALLLMLAFWCSRLRHLDAAVVFPAALFVLALLACCLWDDLLSKRAVWLAAAILFTNPEKTIHESGISR